MKTKQLLCTALLLTTVAAARSLPALAQDSDKSNEHSARNKDSSATSKATASHPHRVSEQELKNKVTKINKASNFIGMTVKNLQNDSLGKVDDLAIDPDSGRIAYAVLSVGGFLGMNEKFIAVPLHALTPAPGEDHLVLDADKQRLQRAPGFAKNKWPDLDTPAWAAAAGFATPANREADSKAVGRAGQSGQEQGSASERSESKQFSGKITQMDQTDRKLTVKTAQGVEKTFTLDPAAQLTAAGNNHAQLQDFKEGSKVTVQYTDQGDRSIAKALQSQKSSTASDDDSGDKP